MSSDEDEEDGLSLAGLPPRLPRTGRQRMFLGKLSIGRRKSTGQEFLHTKHPDLPTRSPTVADPEVELQGKRVTRTQSNANVYGFKAQWADALVSQEPMQTSLTQLRQTVQVYEKQASSEKTRYLGKQKSRKTPFKGLERFSTVALEYSKLLDVVMNECPEYVTLAWGVTKLLLVANINHSRLKQNVESHLISIGEQLGLVNQLITYSPTDKMIEYEATECCWLLVLIFVKLASVIEAFAFPWEAKFQKVVSQIDAQIRRIQEIASASHFHATLRSESILLSLCERQHEERESSQQESGSEQLRMQIREEMKREIDGLLRSFDTRWVQRFDELLLQQTVLYEGRHGTGGPDPIDSNEQLALPPSTPQVYLADFVSNPQTLLEFRNEAFPQLQRFDQRESYIRAGSRLLTTHDWQHCVALLRHPSMRSWMSTEKSGLLWVNTYQGHKLDWASVVSTRLADDCARLDSSMTLAHFCQGHSTGNAVSTAAILIQSLISQSVSLHRERFTVRTLELTQQRFQDAQNDVDRLWTLFLDILGLAAKGKCVWIVIDHVDILQNETNLRGLENALELFRNLDALTDGSAITVKILITARIRDAARLSTKIAEARILASRHAIITVPRGHHRNEATLLAKSSKKISRLPEPNLYPEIPTSVVSVESLLSNSDSDSDSLEASTAEAEQTAKRKPETAAAHKMIIDDDTGESDSDSLFDPFASSDDSEPTTSSKKAALHYYSSEASADEDFSSSKPFGAFAKEIRWESTDDEDHLRKQSTSPLTPKIRVASSKHSPCSARSRSGSRQDVFDASAKETKAQPEFSTPKAANFGCGTNGLSSDSHSDDAFV